MDDKMGPGEVKLLSVMSGADSAESIKLKDAEHLAGRATSSFFSVYFL